MTGAQWAREASMELAVMPHVRVLPRTSVFGVYDGSTYGAVERVADHLAVPQAHQPRQRYWKIVARRTILAAGAIERPIVFGGNDRPGVMMASAVRTYLNRFGVAAGRRACVFTATDDGWKTAIDLANAGVAIEAIVDARVDVNASLAATAQRIGVRFIAGGRVVGAGGGRSLSGVTVQEGGKLVQLDADLLAVSGGWNPTMALSTHLGGRPRWRPELSAFVAGEQLPPGMAVVGAASGSFSLADALREGESAGAAAAESTGFRPTPVEPCKADDEEIGVAPFWHVAESRGKAFVDFQHDVTADDIALANREGYRSVELLKRYTTLGMATDQGKTSNVTGLAILASLTERSIPEVGTTVFRPPFSPVSWGAIVGPHRGKALRPTRLTPSHAVGQGARRRLRRGWPMDARPVVSGGRREGLARVGDA
jgi:sarcosine oxidase subunit alpha